MNILATILEPWPDGTVPEDWRKLLIRINAELEPLDA
jgi:hypothetical protein